VSPQQQPAGASSSVGQQLPSQQQQQQQQHREKQQWWQQLDSTLTAVADALQSQRGVTAGLAAGSALGAALLFAVLRQRSRGRSSRRGSKHSAAAAAGSRRAAHTNGTAAAAAVAQHSSSSAQQAKPSSAASSSSAAAAPSPAPPGPNSRVKPSPSCVPTQGGAAVVVRRPIAADNSCMFNAVGYCMHHSTNRAPFLRQVVSREVASDPQVRASCARHGALSAPRARSRVAVCACVVAPISAGASLARPSAQPVRRASTPARPPDTRRLPPPTPTRPPSRSLARSLAGVLCRVPGHGQRGVLRLDRQPRALGWRHRARHSRVTLPARDRRVEPGDGRVPRVWRRAWCVPSRRRRACGVRVVCVRACVRACARACVRACVRGGACRSRRVCCSIVTVTPGPRVVTHTNDPYPPPRRTHTHIHTHHTSHIIQATPSV
jgi:hypothetical protein